MRLASLLFVAALATLVTGCGEPDVIFPPSEGRGGSGGAGGSGADGGSGGAGGAGGQVGGDVAWGRCPSGPGVCKTFAVPLDWEVPEGETIPFFVRRVPSAVQPAQGQVWLLQGGPGVSGWQLTPWAQIYEILFPDHDVYIPDYRGTGHSSWLGCAGDRTDTLSAQCLLALGTRWGTDIQHFSTSAAARDIHAVVEEVRQPGKRVILHGTSYGSFVGNRLLTLFPEMADAALLDSVCPAAGCDVRTERNANLVAAHVFEQCGADPFCSGKLGLDPYATLLDVLDRMKAGHCAALMEWPDNQLLLERLVLVLVSSRETLPMALAATYRADRCDPADVAAIESLVDMLMMPSGFETDPSGDRSTYLRNQIVFSEFWPDGLDEESARGETEALPLQPFDQLGTQAAARAEWPWPLFPTPAGEKRWAGAETPLLVLNGDLDIQTHVDGLHDLEASFRNESQQLVIVPFVGHGVVSSSAVVPDAGGRTCGLLLMEEFFTDPTRAVDTACAQNAPGPDFVGTPELANTAFGAADLWENDAAARVALQAPLLPGQERALEEARRRFRDPQRW